MVPPLGASPLRFCVQFFYVIVRDISKTLAIASALRAILAALLANCASTAWYPFFGGDDVRMGIP
jgi:hypothetical protein